jgi:hypothetical protein
MDSDLLALSSDMMATASGYCLTVEQRAQLPPTLEILKREMRYSRSVSPAMLPRLSARGFSCGFGCGCGLRLGPRPQLAARSKGGVGAIPPRMSQTVFHMLPVVYLPNGGAWEGGWGR